MFPTKEEALEIAKSYIPVDSRISEITDSNTKLKNVYMLPEGCWYVIYTPAALHQLHSSYFIAISKVDGRLIMHEMLNDEG